MTRRVIYPPVWLLLGLIAVFALNETWPLLRFTSLAWQVVGGVVIVQLAPVLAERSRRLAG